MTTLSTPGAQPRIEAARALLKGGQDALRPYDSVSEPEALAELAPALFICATAIVEGLHALALVLEWRTP